MSRSGGGAASRFRRFFFRLLTLAHYLAFQLNYQGRGRGIVVMPLSSALSNLVPIFGGIVAFGERLPEGTPAAAMRVGAFALTIASGALLSATREVE